MRSCYYLKLTVIIGFSFYTTAKAKGQTRTLEDKVIKIGSYNLENLWDGNPDNTPRTWTKFRQNLPPKQRTRYPTRIQYFDYNSVSSNWHQTSVLKAKIRSVIEVVELMGAPEVLALQEIESAGNTSEVFDLPYSDKLSFRDKLTEMGYQYFIIGMQERDNPVAVTTAVIAKIPIRSLPPLKIRFANDTSSRDIQVVEAMVGSGRLVLFNSHWKSKRGGNEEFRVLTAKALKHRIAEERKEFADTDIIAVGDFNAAYHEAPLAALGCTGEEVKMLGAASSQLYNLWFELPYADRWEHSFDGSRSTLSHMVISDSLYDHIGLQYIDQSFIAVGQRGEAAKKLLGVNGTPNRWQTRKVGKKVYHLGKGYSDHLPLLASFLIKNALPEHTNPHDKIDIPSPGHDDKADEPSPVRLDHVELCQPEEAIDLQEIEPSKLESYSRRCVSIEIPDEQPGLELMGRGPYHASYIELPLTTHAKASLDHLNIGLTMTRAYDWRPNLDDSRVSHAEASIPGGDYHPGYWHPRSNKCFLRKVIQGSGGRLRKALGRLDFSDGYLSIHIASRQAKDVVLEELPALKRASCRW